MSQLGAEVDARDGAGMTPLHLAAQHCRLETARLLVMTLGADATARSAVGGWSPTEFAARHGRSAAVRALIRELMAIGTADT